MLAFWPSDAVLVGTQAALVCGPRPGLPAPLLRFRTSLWAWLLPVSLGGTIAVLALLPGLGLAYAWVSLIGIPVLAAVAVASSLRALAEPRTRALIGAGGAAVLFAAAWVRVGHLAGEAAAVALTALSCCTLASYLAQLAPRPILKVGLVAMAALDAILVFGQLLEGPNNTLNAATPGHQLPHLQMAIFGSALVGYGDLFVAAVLGNIVDGRRARLIAFLVVLACSSAFDLLFLVVDELPATVPVAVAVAMLLLQPAAARARRRASRLPRVSTAR